MCSCRDDGTFNAIFVVVEELASNANTKDATPLFTLLVRNLLGFQYPASSPLLMVSMRGVVERSVINTAQLFA